MQTTDRTEWLPAARDLPALGALTLAYWAAAVAGLQWAVVPGAGPAVWLPSGLLVAAMVLRGPQLWPAAFAGRVLAAWSIGSPQPLWAELLLGATAALGVLLPVWMLRRASDFDPRLTSLSDVIRLVGLGALGVAVSSPIALAGLWLSGTAAAQLPALFMTSFLASVVGLMVMAPAILSWSTRAQWRLPPLAWAHLGVCLVAVAAVSGLIFLSPPHAYFRTWHLFPALVWAALAFSVRGASLAITVTFAFASAAAILNLGPLAELADTATGRLLFTQQFMAASGITVLILAAVADERRSKEQLAASETLLRAETEALETLNQTGAMIAAELDQATVVQKVTDAGVALSGAEFGAFFYNLIREDGGAYTLYTLSGAPHSAFEDFGMPRATAVFHPTFAGSSIVRSDDITREPRYGQMGPHHGMPQGHLPVRSYLAVPVRSRSGEVLGGLFFGHPEPGVFTDRAERLISGIAAQAAIAIDNARLYQAAQREIDERRRAEEHQRLLINELNHRVKNTLATVQSIAAQTARTVGDPAHAYDAFIARLMALSRAHDVLTRQSWEGADLAAVVQGAISPFGGAHGERFRLSGPAVWLEPQPALALAMALHELGTNASKYGALAKGAGRVEIDWRVRLSRPDAILSLTWRETGGPQVKPPTRKGFGSRLLERGLPAELAGKVDLDYRPDGLVCVIEARLKDGADETAAESA